MQAANMATCSPEQRSELHQLSWHCAWNMLSMGALLAHELVAARWFGPVPSQKAQSQMQNAAQQEVKTLHGQNGPRAVASPSRLMHSCSAPAAPACSRGLLTRTLLSGQHYFRLRGCAVPKLGPHSALRPLDLSLKTPAAAQAWRKLGHPFNHVFGQSPVTHRSFACWPLTSS